jgi:cell division protein FtsI/penicillin-binding protein 2
VNIPGKANHILNIILIALAFIVVRIWFLAVIQHEEHSAKAAKPRQREVAIEAERGTIRDRYNLPLAVNKLQYQVAVLYSQIREVPAIVWKIDQDGNRVKTYRRREYVEELSASMGEILSIDPERIEDLIYSKAALYHQRPFVIQEELSEEQYYRLKAMEKDWPGLVAQRSSYRHYPMGKLACDVIGYLGAINRQEYESVFSEMRQLEKFIKEWEAGHDPSLPEGLATSRDVRVRLKELKEKSYHLNDHLGKTGIEAQYEDELRGFRGKTVYYSDAKGNFLRELPGSYPPIPGQRVMLSLSAELQAYVEELLIKNEKIRDGRSTYFNQNTGSRTSLAQPWIKGGGVVVMDPQSGEILALASNPRFDPNDFISQGSRLSKQKKQKNLKRWLEGENYIAALWDQSLGLQRENWQAGKIVDEEKWITWDEYIQSILPQNNSVRHAIEEYGTVFDAIQYQRIFEDLVETVHDDPWICMDALFTGTEHTSHYDSYLAAFDLDEEELENARQVLEKPLHKIQHNDDKILLIDLYRLAVDPSHFSEELLATVGKRSLNCYRQDTVSYMHLDEALRLIAKDLFHSLGFSDWRKENEKAFLKEKRAEEQKNNRYAKPYLDYLDQEEEKQFLALWKEIRLEAIQAFLFGEGSSKEEAWEPYLENYREWHTELLAGAHQGEVWYESYQSLNESLMDLEPRTIVKYLETVRSYKDLNRPLLGKYSQLRKENGKQSEKHLAAAFYPLYGFSYGRSYAYRQSTPQGSIFKIITAYEALRQRYRKLEEMEDLNGDINPLTVIDHVKKVSSGWSLGSFMDGSSIPRLYKGGRLPRSARRDIGQVDIFRAFASSANPYFSLLAGEYLEDPEDLNLAAKSFSYGARTGIDLPGEFAGSLPSDLRSNRTGLYSYAIGQHSLTATPLQSAVMLSAIANGGKILKPHLLKLRLGNEPDFLGNQFSSRSVFPYQDSLSLVGIDFPLLLKSGERKQKRELSINSVELQREIEFPDRVKQTLHKMLGLSMSNTLRDGGNSLSWVYNSDRKAVKDLIEMKEKILGKSSTSQCVEVVNMDREYGRNMYDHIWFGAICNVDANDSKTYVVKDENGDPELVVVVYLRYGGWGKESAPLVAQISNRWKEIRQEHGEL